MTNRAKPITLGHIGLAVLCLAPLLQPYEGMFDFRLVLYGGLSALALVAGLAYAVGLPLITLIFDVPLLLFSLPWFMKALRDDSGPWGVLSSELLWSGSIVALTTITALVALVDGLRWARRAFRSHPQADAKAVFLQPGDRGRPGD